MYSLAAKEELLTQLTVLSSLSELCYDAANGFVMKDGFVYHQLPESEMVAVTQSTREEREQDGRLLGWPLVNS